MGGIQRIADAGRSSRRNWMEVDSRRCISSSSILSHATFSYGWYWCSDRSCVRDRHGVGDAQHYELNEKGANFDVHDFALRFVWFYRRISILAHLQILRGAELESKYDGDRHCSTWGFRERVHHFEYLPEFCRCCNCCELSDHHRAFLALGYNLCPNGFHRSIHRTEGAGD